MSVFNLGSYLEISFLGIVFFWLIIVSFLVLKLTRHYNNLTQGFTKANLVEVLEKILGNIKILDEKIEVVNKRIEEQEKDSLTHLQKFEILRFNPFEDVGGNQSFVVALLDKEDNGIVLTALTPRVGTTRWYGKVVKNGQGVEYELSKEEKEAIRQAAIKGKTIKIQK